MKTTGRAISILSSFLLAFSFQAQAITACDPGANVDNNTECVANKRPLANAGNNQKAVVGETVKLDGSRSSDLEGDPLAFHWKLIATPEGSTATLADRRSVMPTFVPDVAGKYKVLLIVHDGLKKSKPDKVIIFARPGNAQPRADAGPDQTVPVGDTVTLDGSDSSDPDDDTLSFSWSLVSFPQGSTAALSDPSSVMPSFVADLAGDYEIRLIVNDGREDSRPDTVVVQTQAGNERPDADAGPDLTVAVGDTVSLDGAASSDPDGDMLSFLWTFVSTPEDSTAALSDPNAVMPSFTADVQGEYVVQLVVNDGLVDSHSQDL